MYTFFGIYSFLIIGCMVAYFVFFAIIALKGLNKSLNIHIKSLILIFAIILIVCGYGIAILSINWPIDDFGVASSGLFGDSFGFLSALFSGLAFGGLIWTIFLQREDLKETKREVADNRDIMRRQNFETTFFNMLQIHNKIIEDIDIERPGQEFRGRDCFKRINEEMVFIFNSIKSADEECDDIELVESAYSKLHKAYCHEIEHYFRNIYNIIKFIKNTIILDCDELNDLEKQKYANILAAQLSTYEIILLFYNGLSEHGRRRAKPLIEEFALLENMNQDELVSYQILNAYDRSAYGSKIPKKYDTSS